jgi:tetratricopeptide (TPR) repeat protein
MTKYRIRLRNGRVIGPFNDNQLLELKEKGHISGNEEAQIFPTGDWQPIQSFDFYKNLLKHNSTEKKEIEKKEETFVFNLEKLKNQKNQNEIDQIDITHHEPIANLTETIRIASPIQVTPQKEQNFDLELDQHSEPELEIQKDNLPVEMEIENKEERFDKTQINPIAQKEIEQMRKKKKEDEEKLRAQEEEKRRVQEEEEIKKREEKQVAVYDESTQMIKMDQVKGDLILMAETEEKNIAQVEKEIKKKKKKEDQKKAADEEEDGPDEKKGKNKKLIIMVAALAILYAVLFPNDDEKSKKPSFVHIEPLIEFPVPFDKADTKKAQIEYDKAREFFTKGDYKNIIMAGKLLKSSYENNIESDEIVSLLVRSYAEQLPYSREDKQANAQIIFNLIQAKRPFLSKDPNGVIGLNLFYMAINKPEAAADVIAKYLKLYPKNVTEDLFAVYLKSLLKLGKLDMAKQFSDALIKAKEKNRYTLDALIELSLLNQESEKALEYIDDGLKRFPHLVGFYLKKTDFLIKEKKFKEADLLLQKCEELGLENNDLNRASYLILKGLVIAYQGDSKRATTFFKKSLEIQDSTELRMKLADLESSDQLQTEADQLIAESKAIKLLIQARDFFEKKSYELALSYAAKASDAMPGYIPADLFLAKVQLRLGLARQGLKTLEDLIKKYPEDKSINLALIDAYISTYKFNDAKSRIGILSGSEFKHSYEFASANGRLYMQMGDSLQAIAWLRNSINMNPLNDEDIYHLANMLIKRANFDAARILLNKCMELDPLKPDYRIAYSKIVYEQQDDLAAIGYLLGLMNEFGENPKIMAEIAIFYYRAGKVKDFQAYREKLEKLPVRDKALYEFLIRAALLDERFNEIPELVENLLRIEPGELESMMTAGRVLFENGKLVEAAKWFKRLQEKLETYPKVQYYIAKIKFLSKDYDGALKDVEADLKANGDNDADLTLIAQIYVEKGDLVQAENLFKKSQKINPKAYESLLGLADISTKRNNFDLALDLYKKAMKEKGDEPIIHKKIGDVYRLLGQGSLAVESYRLYLEMNPEAPDKAQVESYINLMQ